MYKFETINLLEDNIEVCFLFFFSTLCGLWDFSSQTRDQTQALGSESMES